MIQTLFPDSRGRVTILKHLRKVGWNAGEGIEVEFPEPIELHINKKPGGTE